MLEKLPPPEIAETEDKDLNLLSTTAFRKIESKIRERDNRKKDETTCNELLKSLNNIDRENESS